MTDFLSSLKADLLDRRMLPLVIVVSVALAAAVAYAVLAGGSSTATPSAVAPASPVTGTAPGLPITEKSPEQAVAETAGGGTTQHRGVARNPFTPLPEAKAKTSTSTEGKSSSASGSSSSGSSAGSGSGSSGSSGSGSSGGSGEPTPAKPSKPSKPKTLYHVAVLFGVLPAGTLPANAQLTPYENLKLLTPLPSASGALIVFRGVTAGGKSATFTLAGEAILHGPATCLPSTTQCEAIDLASGDAEQLEFLNAAGVSEMYELRVVSIVSGKASAAAVRDALRSESKSGRELLKREGLLQIPDLSSSSQVGVLVFAARHAFGASAHPAGHAQHGR
ncbi:MAG TPA: hypothetical protein VK272_13905 [Solirubrobacteraceae bacterium]|nr:hypothetical protein [Solirubrobacteraceae bacterium]HLM87270.1 hypothetical protein [Solirubrobacteraceae bacterium]